MACVVGVGLAKDKTHDGTSVEFHSVRIIITGFIKGISGKMSVKKVLVIFYGKFFFLSSFSDSMNIKLYR